MQLFSGIMMTDIVVTTTSSVDKRSNFSIGTNGTNTSQKLYGVLPILLLILFGLPGNLITLSIAIRQLTFKVVRSRKHEIYLSELACLDILLLLFWLSNLIIELVYGHVSWWSPPCKNSSHTPSLLLIQLSHDLDNYDAHHVRPIYSCHCISFLVRFLIELRCWLLVIFLMQKCIKSSRSRMLINSSSFITGTDSSGYATDFRLASPTIRTTGASHQLHESPNELSKFDRIRNYTNSHRRAAVAKASGGSSKSARRHALLPSNNVYPTVKTSFTLHSAFSNLITCFLLGAVLILKNSYAYLYLIRYPPRDHDYTLIYECAFTSSDYLHHTRFFEHPRIRMVKAISDGLGILIPYILVLICMIRTSYGLIMTTQLCISIRKWILRYYNCDTNNVNRSSQNILGSNFLYKNPSATTIGLNALSCVPNKSNFRSQRGQRQRALSLISLSTVFLVTYGPIVSIHTWIPYLLPADMYAQIQHTLHQLSIRAIYVNHIMLFYVCLLTDRHFQFDVTQIVCFCCCINHCYRLCLHRFNSFHSFGQSMNRNDEHPRLIGKQTYTRNMNKRFIFKHLRFKRRARVSVAYFYQNWQDMVKGKVGTGDNDRNIEGSTINPSDNQRTSGIDSLLKTRMNSNLEQPKYDDQVPRASIVDDQIYSYQHQQVCESTKRKFYYNYTYNQFDLPLAAVNDRVATEINDRRFAAINDRTPAATNDLTAPTINDRASVAINDRTSAATNDGPPAVVNDRAAPAINDGIAAPINDLAAGATHDCLTAATDDLPADAINNQAAGTTHDRLVTAALSSKHIRSWRSLCSTSSMHMRISVREKQRTKSATK
ncbi:hypothetical protein GJ496_006342 [Pomphorhynchus laevis]|nr:hypothetical protein GJ496_006342 [Pomphorhynchus laevis]